jgi:putative superfamily III holin-X
MPYERLASSELIRAFSDALGDLSDLIQKEIHLAKAELGEKITSKLQAGGWVGAAAFCGILAVVFLLEAAVFALTAFGLAPYWAALLVAAVLGAAAAACFYHGRSLAQEELTPTRALTQVGRDVQTAKEQLT